MSKSSAKTRKSSRERAKDRIVLAGPVRVLPATAVVIPPVDGFQLQTPTS